MVNEYGVELDRNGYAPSLFPVGACIFCGSTEPLNRHEVFHGPYRSKAKRLGLWANICPECHRQLHNSRPEMDKQLKQVGQWAAMGHYGWTVQQFRDNFGKSYL